MAEPNYNVFTKFLEGCDIRCTLNDNVSGSYCPKYEGEPCCFFCREKEKCCRACKNDPTVCGQASNFEKERSKTDEAQEAEDNH